MKSTLAVPEVGILDYQSGNIRSIANAFQHLGARVESVRTPTDVACATHLVLPGVGAFGFCIDRLRLSGLLTVVQEWTFVHKRPILGVCVGMQMLADSSEESREQQGLGWLGGKVRKLQRSEPEIRVPHVGWDSVTFEEDFGDFLKGDSSDFYFDHSYAYDIPSRGQVLGTCIHGDRFCAAIRHENLVAVQFHPEKSQAAGIRFIRGFLAL